MPRSVFQSIPSARHLARALEAMSKALSDESYGQTIDGHDLSIAGAELARFLRVLCRDMLTHDEFDVSFGGMAIMALEVGDIPPANMWLIRERERSVETGVDFDAELTVIFDERINSIRADLDSIDR